MSLPYFAADTLGMVLYQVKDQLVGAEYRKIALGGWRFDLKVEAASDLSTAKEITFWVTLQNRIPCYLVVRDKECWLLVLDPQHPALVNRASLPVDLTEKLTALKPALKKAFHWKGERWSPVIIAAPETTAIAPVRVEEATSAI